jgi:predicted  nucleic acid-binding Zn-ribbon protein
MSNITPISTPSGDFKPKTFWQKPEGVTGLIFMSGIVLGGGYLLYKALPYLISLTSNLLYLSLLLIALAAVVYMVLDPRMRNLIWFGYKSIMRSITGMFVQIDPIGILKSYVESLGENLAKMSKQIGVLQGQMQKMKMLIDTNNSDIKNSMKFAEQAKKQGDEGQIVLHTRKAGRLQESNEKYEALYKRMEILKRVLSKMYDNSGILLEDTKDQVKVKEQERVAIRASHSAMRSAMSILSGDPDKRAMFEMAMESINNDVASKVGEMERFMEMSGSIMSSIDLQNGVLEDEGMKMLEEWEKNSSLMLLDSGNVKSQSAASETLELKSPSADKQASSDANDYDNMFK